MTHLRETVRSAGSSGPRAVLVAPGLLDSPGGRG
jgi:hypothetical protein